MAPNQKNSLQELLSRLPQIVIAIIGDKGGIGKTLVGYNLIYRFLQEIKEVQLVDCDHAQFSSFTFSEIRKQNNVTPSLPIYNVPPSKLEKFLVNSKEKITLIEFGKSFGGNEDDEAKRKKVLELAIKLADLVIAPMQASPVDAVAFGSFEEALPKEITKIPAMLIPNRVKTKARLKLVLNSAPDLTYFKVSNSYISDLLCYQDSFFDSGRTIFEIKPKTKQDSKGQTEFENIYQEIITTLCKFYG